MLERGENHLMGETLESKKMELKMTIQQAVMLNLKRIDGAKSSSEHIDGFVKWGQSGMSERFAQIFDSERVTEILSGEVTPESINIAVEYISQQMSKVEN